ncbi:MAG: hypothetical protein BSR46_00530 [Candidatus Dactylopiibacterium carminicum]|nr:MAG: hypothetical protein BSR46_00530 [Candidatus Dactylopiibacterium carminicum]
MPLLTILALVSFVGLVTWFGLAQERDERRAMLISDTLWMEQNLRFQFESTGNELLRVGNQFGIGGEIHSDAAQEKIRELLQGDSGLIAILWLDSNGLLLSTLPASAAPIRLSDEHAITVMRARTLNRPVYSPPYAQPDGMGVIELALPVFGTNDFHGYAIGIFSLPKVISRHVPWWFAERYRLSFIDGDGKALAATTDAGSISPEAGFSVRFDHMNSLGIRVDSYRATTRVTPLLVILVLGGLSLVIAWSLWMLRNRVLRLQETESALRAEHAFRIAMENSTQVGLRARNLQGRITYVNAAFCRMVGWPEDQLRGHQPPMPYWPEQDAAMQTIEPLHLADAPTKTAETRYRRQDGQLFDALVFEAPMIDADGVHTGWVGSVLDITERKRTEVLAREQQQHLEATARLVTMGEMASTLAHELNQPLSAIASYSAGCLNALKAGRFDEKQFTDILGKINYQAQRAGRIIHRIYGFVRRSESRREQMQVNAAIREAAGLLEPDLQRRHIKLQLVLNEDLPLIHGDRVMIEQLVLNLMRNGMDAMHDQPDTRRMLRVGSESCSGGVRLWVADQGGGVPAEIADQLFDSFFTTKPEGMGMGLKICRSIAEQHNGRLWFEPAEGGGTSFFLQLPLGEADDA